MLYSIHYISLSISHIQYMSYVVSMRVRVHIYIYRYIGRFRYRYRTHVYICIYFCIYLVCYEKVHSFLRPPKAQSPACNLLFEFLQVQLKQHLPTSNAACRSPTLQSPKQQATSNPYTGSLKRSLKIPEKPPSRHRDLQLRDPRRCSTKLSQSLHVGPDHV